MKATLHSDHGSHYARCESSLHGIFGWTSFSVSSVELATELAEEHHRKHLQGSWEPRGKASLVRTMGQVSVVRFHDGIGPVWTVHLRGEAPIYVALVKSDAMRVATHHSAALWAAEADAFTAEPDSHGNLIAQEGCTRCLCGAKYWERDHCVSCGAHVSQAVGA